MRTLIKKLKIKLGLIKTYEIVNLDKTEVVNAIPRKVRLCDCCGEVVIESGAKIWDDDICVCKKCPDPMTYKYNN